MKLLRIGQYVDRCIFIKVIMIGNISTKSPKDESVEQAQGSSLERVPQLASSGPRAEVLALQDAAGNRAVSQLLQSDIGNLAPGGNGLPPIVQDVLRSPGQPLDPAARAFMESHFGHDFSQVQIHTDAKADRLSRSLNARAFTIGRDIFFRAGECDLGSVVGQMLLAHELSHVVQQVTGNVKLIQKQDESSEPTRREIEQDVRLRRLGRFPREAHRNWRRLNSVERRIVYLRMIDRYGLEFARQFLDFASQGQFDDTVDWANVPEATIYIRYLGFRSLEAAGFQFAGVDRSGVETWVRPSGRTIRLLHGRSRTVASPATAAPPSERSEETGSAQRQSRTGSPSFISIPDDPTVPYGAYEHAVIITAGEVLGPDETTCNQLSRFRDGTIECVDGERERVTTFRMVFGSETEDGLCALYDRYDPDGVRITPEPIEICFDEIGIPPLPRRDHGI